MQIFTLCLAAALSFLMAALSGKIVIPALKRLHIGQTISVYVKEHQSKANTPMMGGVMFIVPTVLLTLVLTLILPLMGISGGAAPVKRIAVSLIMIIAMTAVGFTDDYIKVVKKRNVGLTELQKTAMQVIIIALYLGAMKLIGCVNTSVLIPFTSFRFDLWIFYYPVMLVLIYGFVNAVNITDGIDGLCSSVTLIVCCFFVPTAFAANVFEHSILAAACAGGLLGFLVWNFHPAKVFMGDTGSMFLGALFCALAFAVDMPLIMLPVGIIYLIEIGSDVIQIGLIKATKGKKKAFKMAPIHHHYQLSGWGEVKIVVTFSAITLIFCGLTAFWLFTGIYI